MWQMSSAARVSTSANAAAILAPCLPEKRVGVVGTSGVTPSRWHCVAMVQLARDAQLSVLTRVSLIQCTRVMPLGSNAGSSPPEILTSFTSANSKMQNKISDLSMNNFRTTIKDTSTFVYNQALVLAASNRSQHRDAAPAANAPAARKSRRGRVPD